VLQQLREDILSRYRIPEQWWLSQPVITSKTYWITLDADHSAKRRTELQIAIAEFGIEMVSHISNTDFYLDEETTTEDDDELSFIPEREVSPAPSGASA